MAGRIQGDLGAALGAGRALGPRRRAKRAAVWLGLAVSALFLWLVLRRVDFGATWRAFGEVRWWVLPPSLGLFAVGVWLRALRWQALFVPESRPRLGPTARALLAGLLFNILLPARAGEAVRVVLLSRETGNPRAEVIATAVSERVYDVLALLALLLVAAPFFPHVSWLATAAVVAAVLIVALVAAALVLVRHGDRPLRFLLRRLPFMSEQAADGAASNLVRGFASIMRPGIALRAVVLTLASWLVLGGSAAVLLAGFSFGAGLGFGAGLLVVVATNLAMVLPSSPAAVGPFEAAVLVALSAFQIGSSNALSYALLLHAENLFPLLLAGYVAVHGHLAAAREQTAGSTP